MSVSVDAAEQGRRSGGNVDGDSVEVGSVAVSLRGNATAALSPLQAGSRRESATEEVAGKAKN